jgi:magnesium transporter
VPQSDWPGIRPLDLSGLRRLLPSRSHKVGLPPGSLVYEGEPRPDARLDVFDYGSERTEEAAFGTLLELPETPDWASVRWLNVIGIHDVDLVAAIGEKYGIHPLVQEDIVSVGQRPRLDEAAEPLYLVIDMLRFDERTARIEIEQVSIVLGKGYVLTFQVYEEDVFGQIRDRLRAAQGRIRRRGADYLVYALVDSIIDNYFLVLDKLGEQFVTLEEEVFDRASTKTRRELNLLRRELILLRRAVWPVRELVSQLERTESTLVSAETRRFVRDTYDHAVQVLDVVESMRDMTSGLMDLYLSELSHRLNETMKFLTMIGTIFIPLTFIVGVYGMNFSVMPELEWPLGYPLIWLLMIVVAVGMVAYFRFKKWL